MADWSEFNRSTLLLLGDWNGGWLAVFIVAALVVLAATWLDVRELRRSRRWALLGLRTFVLALGVLLLLEPAIERKHVTVVPNTVGVILDDSISQRLPASERQTRAEWAAAAMEELAGLSHEDHRFAFLDLGGAAVDASAVDASDSRFGRDETSLLEAMEAFEATQDDLGGFVIVSDGIDRGALGGRVTAGGELDTTTLQTLQERGVPVHTVATASDDVLRDVAIRRVLRDDFAFVRNAVSVSVDLRAPGYEGRTVDVTLFREGVPLRTRAVTLPNSGEDVRVDFEFVPETIGKEIYHVGVPVLEGEALAENNQSYFVLQVIRDQIRALQVVGHPSWDVRFLRQLLTGNPNVDLISFFILRTVDDMRRANNDEMSLIPFPTRELFEEQLGSFDIVVFQNFDYGPYEMARYLPNVRDYIERGGGFLMIGGDRSFASGGYAGTELADMLPVTLPASGSPSALVDLDRFRPELTDAGRRHPITRLTFDRDDNNALWEQLPEMRGTNIVAGAHDDATVLATHPARGADEGMPVISVREVGEGRTMAVTVDGTWRWSFEGLRDGATADPYAAFYQSAIRWLIRDPELHLVQVEIDQDEQRPGEEVTGLVRAFRADYQPAVAATGTLTISRRPLDNWSDDAREVIETRAIETDAQGRVALTFVPSEPGAWQVEASIELADGQIETDDEIVLVVDATDELRDIQPRPELLRALSDATDARFAQSPRDIGSMRFAPPRIEQVDRREVIELWSQPWLLLVLAMALAAEWSLRRRWGRL